MTIDSREPRGVRTWVTSYWELKPRQKALVRKVCEAKGVRAAMGKARELVRS